MTESVRFDDFMHAALYGSDGFYTSGRGSAGRRHGDFITSPEVGPLFGEVVARWIDEVWEEAGRPEPFDVFDLGAGPGRLTTSLAMAPVACAGVWTLHDVDLAAGTELPADLRSGVVVANEVLDNVPFRWVRRDGRRATEAYVVGDELDWWPVDDHACPPADGEFPWLERAAGLLGSVLDANPLRVVAFDYGTATTGELARRGGWLRCYRGHRRGDDPLAEPGRWDITTDVPLDQFPPPRRTWSQAEFCRRFGIDDLVEQGRAIWRARAAQPDLRAVRMRSRVSEAAALTDPGGLGGFWVAEWT